MLNDTNQIFIGQVMGTSVGTKVFLEHGWRAGAALSLAWCGFCVFAMLIRGPNVRRYTWVGWEGGWEVRKDRVAAREAGKIGKEDVEKGVGEDGERDEKADVRVEGMRRSDEKARRSMSIPESIRKHDDTDERSLADEKINNDTTRTA